MRNRFIKASALAAVFLIAASAHAATTLSLSTTGNADGVRLQVVSDARSKITLNYVDSSGDTQTLSLGTTDQDGYLSSTVYASDKGIVPGTSVSVTSNATGSRSSNVIWPLSSSSEPSLLFDTFSLPIGESTSIFINNPSSVGLSLKSNSNPSVASASLDESQIGLTGKAAGSTVVTVCLTAFPSDCKTLTVTVGGQGTGSASALPVSQTNPVVVVGKTTTFVVNGSAQGLYVSDNSNPGIAQVNVLNNSITVIGNTIGNTNATVCNSSNQCAVLAISVIAADTTSDPGPTVSRSTVSLTSGNTANVLVAGLGNYTVSSDEDTIASTTLVNGTKVSILGLAPGRATVTVCDTANDCAYVLVIVSARPVSSAPATSAPATTPVPTTAPASVFQSYLTPGSQGAEVTALQQVLAAQGYFSGSATGYFGTVTQNAVIAFQAAHDLAQLGVVGPATRAALNALGTSTTPSASTTATSSGDGYTFSNFIGAGSTGTDVTELQKRLTALGMYTGPVTGYFGSLTAAAVAAFQASHSITQAGYVGPATRAALNAQ